MVDLNFLGAKIQRISVVENTLGNKTTWNSWPLGFEFITIQTHLLVLPEVTNLDDWVTVSKLVDREIFTVQLVGIS